jgi:MoaA/NifB/PqqE/SkfB family radical SAM enzyme
MKAKIKPRINLEDRTRLEKVIPLSTPMILFVDPSSACNFKCKFCPTGNQELTRKTGRKQGLMDFELYKKVIDDLKEFDKHLKVLRLYKEGEPLLNPRLADMVGYAKASGVVDYIDTTTNASLMTPEKIRPVIEAGLDKINISVDGMSSEQFLEFTGAKVDYKQYVENIRSLYAMKGKCEIVIKTTGDFLTDEEKKRFYDTFGDYTDRIFIENAAPCWPEFDVENRLGIKITKGIYDQPIGSVNTCPYIFYQMSVNSDGTVSLCFLDWARKLIIGDAHKQSIKEIWEGQSLFDYQMTHLRGKRTEIAVCAACGQLSHGLPDDIDPYAKELAAKLLTARKKEA